LKTLIRAKELCKDYQLGEITVHALKRVSFEIYQGEFIVILGPSGSGKSTLLNMVGGIESASSGEILYQELKLHEADTRSLTGYRRKHVGFVFQFYNLMPGLTALENDYYTEEGNLSFGQDYVVVSRVAGPVKAVMIEENAVVREGEILFTVDDRDLQYEKSLYESNLSGLRCPDRRYHQGLHCNSRPGRRGDLTSGSGAVHDPGRRSCRRHQQQGQGFGGSKGADQYCTLSEAGRSGGDYPEIKRTGQCLSGNGQPGI